MKLHEKLNKYLKAHGIKQTHVAEKAEMSVKTLNAILLGRQRLTADTLEIICRKGLDIEPAYFFEQKVLEDKNIPKSPGNMLPAETS